MTSSALVLLMLSPLAGPGSLQASRPSTAQQPAVISPHQLRQSYRTALSNAAKKRNRDPAVTVPQLVAVHRALTRHTGLPAREKRRMQRRVEGRLRAIQASLIRQSSNNRRRASQSLSGGGAAGGLQQLSGLIQSTVRPDCWAVNGGGLAFLPAGGGLAGGGNKAGGGNNGGGGNSGAQSLIDLIQATIKPNSWDINGGNGAIFPVAF